MQGQSDAATHDEYIERLGEPRRGDIRALHELIRATVPQLEPTRFKRLSDVDGDVLAQILRTAAANPPGSLATA